MKRLNTLSSLATALILFGGPMALGDHHGSGFKPIFDGKTLKGWDGDPQHWRVEDGAITGRNSAEEPLKANSFIIWRQGEVDDFELKLEYRISGGNSGIQYRSFERPSRQWSVGGYQADMEAGDTWSGALYGEHFRKILARRGQKTVITDDHRPRVVGSTGDSALLQSQIRKDDWNEYHIIARGDHFTHKINGHTMIECTDEDTAMRRRSGILALQAHRGPPMKVQFRKIRLKRLKMEGRKKVVFVAGEPSHGWGAHEHNAGSLLLAARLRSHMPAIEPVVYRNGWPADPTAFDNADAVVIFCDGGPRHVAIPHLASLDRLMKKGVGLACLHYAVEIPKGEGGDHMLGWIGGYFETDWSVNPHWTARFETLPDHPITRGVDPFEVKDEWYYHMRFLPQMTGIVPILSAHPPKQTLSRPDGPHSGNPHVRKAVEGGESQHVAWALDRPDGGRGFGFTGLHFHDNLGNDDFRKLLLNAIVWTAGATVPEGGVASPTPTQDELEANQDFPRPK